MQSIMYCQITTELWQLRQHTVAASRTTAKDTDVNRNKEMSLYTTYNHSGRC